jgi:hypothetical protein
MNGLSAVMRFPAAGAAGGAGLGAAEIFGARQFVAGVVDYFIGLQPGWSVGAKAGNLPRENHDDEQEERFQKERRHHAPVREKTVGSFTGQARTTTSESRTDGSDELVPSRGPLNQQLGRVMKLGERDLFELESFAQARVCRSGVGVTGVETRLDTLLYLDFDTIAQCSFCSGYRVAG